MKKEKIFAVVALFCIFACIGCASLSEYLTPGVVDKKAVKYVVDAGVAEPNEYKGYQNLYKAKKLNEDVDIANVLNMQKLEQAMQREETEHNIHKGVTKANYQAAIVREEALFGPTGLLSVGLGALGLGAGGILGLMRKRPGDITPQEMQTALADATGRTTAELSAKEKQLIQVVKGISELKDTYKEQIKTDSSAAVKIVDLLDAMKKSFDAAQDEDTRKAVAVAAKS